MNTHTKPILLDFINDISSYPNHLVVRSIPFIESEFPFDPTTNNSIDSLQQNKDIIIEETSSTRISHHGLKELVGQDYKIVILSKNTDKWFKILAEDAGLDRRIEILGSSLDDSTQSEPQMIKLYSKDNEYIEVNKAYLVESGLITTSLEHEPEATDLRLEIPKVDTLKLIQQYVEHHKGKIEPIVEKPLRHKEMSKNTNEWDAQFVDNIEKTSLNQLYELIAAANYLNMQPLLMLCCAKVASLIKGHPVENLRTILRPSSTSSTSSSSSQTQSTSA